MEITVPMLQNLRACERAVEELKRYFFENNISSISLENLIGEIIARDLFPWGSWLLTRLFTRSAAVAYAGFSANRVLHIYENVYPDDLRPRHAIEAVERYFDGTITVAEAAEVATHAAEAATAAYADAVNTGNAISHAAEAASAAAETTARAAEAAYADRASYANYAGPANHAAVDAVYASAPDSMLVKSEILKFGLLLKKLKGDGKESPLL